MSIELPAQRRRLESDSAISPSDAAAQRSVDVRSAANGVSPLDKFHPNDPDADDTDETDDACSAIGEEEDVPLFSSPPTDGPSHLHADGAETGGRRVLSPLRRVRPPSVCGSVTTLHSFEQMHAVFGTAPLPIAAPSTDAGRLRAGEAALLLLFPDRPSREALLPPTTAALSQTRIFACDLRALHADAMDAAHSLSMATGLTRLHARIERLVGIGSPQSGTPNTPSGRSKRPRAELTFPAMVLWRAEGGPADEYVHRAAEGTGGAVVGRPLVVKPLTSLDQLHSLSLLRPVFTVPQLLRCIADKGLFPHVKGSRTLLYFGASWCPPCMRIVHAMPAMMEEDIPSHVVCTVKADMDLATPIFEFFGVEIIPTFVVLDNDKLRGAGGWEAIWPRRDAEVPEKEMEQLREGLRQSELGRIQNSQRLIVRTFIEKNCKDLCFDEDF